MILAAGQRYLTRSGAVVRVAQRLDTGLIRRDPVTWESRGTAYLFLCVIERFSFGTIAEDDNHRIAVHEDGRYLPDGESPLDLVAELEAVAA
jgi:hypothetical protein